MRSHITKYVIDRIIIDLYDKEYNENQQIILTTKEYNELVKLIKEVENLENKDKELF